MFAKRLLVAIILLPAGILVIHLGGPVFTALIALILGAAGWEYVRLFRAIGFQPAGAIVVVSGVIFALGRAFNGFDSVPLFVTLLVLTSMIFHLVEFERGRQHAGTDFSITLAGALYVGWLGSFLISLRNLPEGVWWFLIVLPAVWLGDSGAYIIGKSFGRRALSPRLSPKKTWEGYIGGIAAGTIGAALLASLWRIGAGPDTAITPWAGAFLGFVLSILTPLGDLGESMLKRQAGVKDSGALFPGHGGVFDRIDSWLWAAPIGYYAILWFFI